MNNLLNNTYIKICIKIQKTLFLFMRAHAYTKHLINYLNYYTYKCTAVRL